MSARISAAAAVLTTICALATAAASADARSDAHRTPSCDGRRATIVGTPGADHIKGTKGNDVIVALGGTDVVDSLGGDDIVCAGPGNDTVEAGGGADIVLGGLGRDWLTGGLGSDVIRDPGGENHVVDVAAPGQTGAVTTGPERDFVSLKGAGSFTATTGAGHDSIDVAETVEAADVHAGDDDDHLTLGGPLYASAVRASLGNGDDSVWCYGSCGGPTVSGGPGVNVFHLRVADGPATVTLGPDGSVVEQVPDQVATLALDGFTQAVLGKEADTVVGSDGDDDIEAGPGDDDVDAGPGDDTVDGGVGTDTCTNAETEWRCEIPPPPPPHRTIADGVAWAPRSSGATGASCGGLPATIVGTPGRDRINGTRGDDVIVGGGGRDRIVGRAGDDVVCGGGGFDTIEAGRGDDRVFGGHGTDEIHGGAGSDRLVDTEGAHSRIFDGAAQSPEAHDVVRTGAGADHVVLGPHGTFVANTGAGRDDVLLADGISGATVHEGAGHDVLGLESPRYPDDVDVWLQGGDDRVYCYNECGGAEVWGGPGRNDLYGGFTGNDLTVVLGPDGEIGHGTTSVAHGFTAVQTGSGNDTVTGSDGDDVILTGPGDDAIDGGPGDDRADAGTGEDTCVNVETTTGCELPEQRDGPAAGSAASPSALDPTVKRCHGHPATIVGTSGDDTLTGTAHADVIVGLGGKDTIRGLAGNDWICGGRGDDDLNDGPGDDHAYGQERYDTLWYSPGDDVLDGGALANKAMYQAAPHGVRVDLRKEVADVGSQQDVVRHVDYLKLSRYADVFVGTSEPETVFSNAGDDRLAGRGGGDFLVASSGDDTVLGGPGSDTIHGNSGTDRLIDLQGSNSISDGATSPSDESGVVRTGPGSDRVFLGFYGSFDVRTGDGRDHVYADRRLAETTIHAGAGNDVIQLNGNGYSGDVVAYLEDGDDALNCADMCGGATVHGGPGVNRVFARFSLADLTVVLGPAGSISSGDAPTIATDFTRAVTGTGADSVTGSSGDDSIATHLGDDVIDGGDGDDDVDAGGGQDTCVNVEIELGCELP